MAVADDLDRATDSTWDWVAQQTRTYLASGGTEGHESNGVHTLVLATTGRRTGEPRRTCLIYGTSGVDFVVVASKGGADQDPDGSRTSRRTRAPGSRSAPVVSPPAPASRPRPSAMPSGPRWCASSRCTTSTRRRPTG